MNKYTYKSYAGVGSRKAPEVVLRVMTAFARVLGMSGLTLRSGAAPGTDTAFERGCDEVSGKKEIYLPREGFQGRCSSEPGCLMTGQCKRARLIASEIHPMWSNCDDRSIEFHTRNVHQVLGEFLDVPVLFIITWTPRGIAFGGTRTAILLGRRYHVPTFNLASYNWTLKEIVREVISRNRIKPC